MKRTIRKKKSHFQRVTYSTLRLTLEDDKEYDYAIRRVGTKLGTRFGNFVNGEALEWSGSEMAHASPVDTRKTVSYFPGGTRDNAKSAIDAARDAFPKWSGLSYKKRANILRKAADLLIKRRYELSAWMAFEVGKNRSESLAEVNESAVLVDYYCDQMQLNQGFVRSLESPGPKQETVSILRPYGVWAVIAPWNFPLALTAGMTTGALVAGNTVVLKPSSESPVLGHELTCALNDAGIPKGVFNFVTGSGETVGAELLENSGVDGLVFTGSKAVGLSLYHNFAKNFPKPIITEMGGKNPTLVTANADLDQAAEGVMRAAFSYGGQKCSACSRVYVDNSVKGKFLEMLKSYTKKLVKIGDPTRKETFLGPVINRTAVETYERAVEETKGDGGRFVYGAKVLKDGEFANGYYVEPAIVDGLPTTHRLFKEELFVPFVATAGVGSFDEAMRHANDTEYGLTAGIYTRDLKEMRVFFDNIQAGVTYANRRAGATTGAWPGINSFGGWKASGCTGKNANGPYYVQQFMREQSRWVVK